MKEIRANHLIRSLALALAVLAGAAVAFLWWGLFNLPTDQAGGIMSGEGVTVTHLNGPPATNPFKLDDVIIHVRGYTAREWNEPNMARTLALLRDSRVGQAATYTLKRNGETVTLSAPLLRIDPLEGWERIGMLLPITLIFLAVGTFVVWRRPQEAVARVLFLGFLAIALNLVDDSVNEANLTWLLAFSPFIHLAEMVTFWFSASLGLHFSLIFPSPREWIRRYPWGLWAIHLVNPVVFLILGSLTGGPLLWSQLNNRVEIGRYVVGLALIAWGIGNLVHSFRTARTPIERAQMRWLAWGTIVGFGPWFVFFMLPLVLLGVRFGIAQAALFWLLMLAVPLSFAFAILRYRLMDIDTVINRSLVYAALSAVLVGVYLILTSGLSRLFVIVTGQYDNTTVVFLSMLGAAAVFIPARSYVQEGIDRLFYRQKLNLPTLLAEWSRTLAMTLDINDLMILLVDKAPASLEVERARVWLWRAESARFVTPADEVLAAGQAANALSETMLAADAPALINPPGAEPELVLAPLRALQFEIAVPLIVGSKLVGLYALGVKRSGLLYNRAEIEFLETLGHQAAIALENSCSYLTIARQVSELATLHAMGRAISAELNLDALLDMVLRQVTTTLGFDRAWVMLVDEERSVLTYGRTTGGTPEQEAKVAVLEIPLGESGGLFAEVLLSGRSRLVDDASLEASGPLGWLIGELATRAFALIPLRVQDKPVGLLAADRVRANASIQADEVSLLDTLASQVAVAVQNARLVKQLAEQERIKQELAIAYRIQTSLLPAHNPNWPGLEVYGLSKPAREVGGDFYSYLTLGEGVVAIAVGDVSGKGVPGALFMAVAMGVMRAQAPAFRSAAELLRTLNSALYEQMITTQMNVALLYAILEAKGDGAWLLRVSNGGLIAPLLLRAGESEYLNISGLPLGAALYASYSEIQVDLSPGDVLVLCSDGITEAMSAERQLFSFNRLQHSLARLKERSAAEIAQGLLKAAYEFAGSEDVEDDVTMVVVRIL